MNVFEDLVQELKDEDLLEETVIDSNLDEKQDTVDEADSPDSIDDAMAAEFESETEEDREQAENEYGGSQETETSARGEEEIPGLELEPSEAQEEQPDHKEPDTLFAEDETAGSDSPDSPEQVGIERFDSSRPAGDSEEVLDKVELTGYSSDEGQQDPINLEESDAELSLDSGDMEPVAQKGSGEEEDVGSEKAANEDSATDLEGEATDELQEEDEKAPAAKEVASYQFVEHQFTTIIRNQLKRETKPSDVVTVKQALHQFEKASKDGDSKVILEAEAALRSELDQWKEELLVRDESISTSLLRKYTEENDLSGQALMHLARFYRNAPFSEATRCKFDFVITQLLTKDSKRNMRAMALERDDLISAVEGFYDDWNSIRAYADDEDDSGIVLAAFKFEDFISEARSHKSFDELIASGFFKRIRAFKKRTGENFFAPLLIASAIECNVAIGNRYVELIELEKKKGGAEELEGKYGSQHDHSVSEAASKTLTFVELLNKKKDQLTGNAWNSKSKSTKRRRRNRKKKETKGLIRVGNFRISKGDAVKVVLIVIGFLFSGYFVYAGFFGSAVELSESERKIQEERSFLHKYVKTSSVGNDTFNGEISDAWKSLDDDTKLEVLSKIYSSGKIKGFKKVELKNDSGRVIAVADGSKLEVKE